MNFIIQVKIFCFAVNVQLIRSNETIYVNFVKETTAHDQTTQIDQNELNQDKPPQPVTDDVLRPLDDYTFLGLIEIMFSDGSRKYCTGTIIHDNIVITASHCLQRDFVSSVELEIKGSFVIIGTQYMFDTGYENYLPIERVLIHPDYKGWNADLALIYTFAGMMSDKPGDTIPLAVENSYTPLYGNVTVLEWNPFQKSSSSPKKSNVPLMEFEYTQETNEEEVYIGKEITHSVVSSNDWSKEVTKEETMKSILIMEEYTIFETDTCIDLLKKLQMQLYHIENVKKTICLVSKYSNKIKAESGAPVVYRNHLVAITAGNINHDSEHIIVATKLNCYCSWIRKNLPSGGKKLKCCANCCY